jgi:uncharacterized protein with HEPN domain
MQSQIKDIDRLMDIHEFASLIIEQVEMITEKEFNNNEVLRWALLKWLENIGEASYQLSRETTLEFDKPDWRSIINARHFYVHQYFDIRWSTVWKTLNTVDYTALRVYANEIAQTLKTRYSII